MRDLLFGAVAGDMAALNVLFVLLLPVVIVVAGVRSLVDWIRRHD